MSEEEYFELNLLRDGEPVEFLVMGVMWSRVRVWVSWRAAPFLDVLKYIEEFGRCAKEDAVAVVNSGSDEGVDQSFCSREGE